MKNLPLATPTTKQQQQPKNSFTKPPENALPRKTIVVNHEVFHFYSLQQINVLDNINTFFSVDLATCRDHTDYSKSNWIQCT